MKNTITDSELPVWLWLWFPVLFLAFIIIVALYDFDLARNIVARENNLVELGTVIILIPAVFAGYKSFKLRKMFPDRRLGIWVFLVTIGCVYIGGEELSWGQQLFKWETPETIQAVNDQNETNLHNISSWLDQKPRLIMEISVLIGGILLPVWRAIRGITYSRDSWHFWFWPGYICLPAALLAILVKIPERLKDFFDYMLFENNLRYSELQEFYFSWFLFLYLYSIYRRLIPRNTAV